MTSLFSPSLLRALIIDLNSERRSSMKLIINFGKIKNRREKSGKKEGMKQMKRTTKIKLYQTQYVQFVYNIEGFSSLATDKAE
jgi:hypothetical protein